MEIGTQKLELAPAVILARYIITELEKMTDPNDEGDWPLYISYLPDDVKTDCGAIYDTAGISDMRSMNGGVPEHPGIQLRIQSREYDDGYEKIEDIARTLDGVVNASIEVDTLEYEIQNVSRASSIVSLGIESGTKRRFSFTVNYLCTFVRLI